MHEERRSKERRDPNSRRWSDHDRRTGDRRQSSLPVEIDRRAGQARGPLQRRSGIDRRAPTDRRFTTVEPFSPAKATHVQEMVNRAGVVLACPLCNGDLIAGPPTERGGQTFREVRCLTCRRGVQVEYAG